MGLTRLDIRKLTVRQYVAPPFPDLLRDKLINQEDVDFNEINSDAANELGMPYFMDFYYSLNGNRRRLPNEPLVSWSLQKNIVETTIVGSKRKGTIKEYISTGDYSIKIQGMCIDPDNENDYPIDQVKELKELAETNAAIDIDNDLLKHFEIYAIVIKSIEFSDMQGIPNAQAYEISAVSDSDFLAQLNQNTTLQDL